MNKEIYVLGAGASGMVAAIVAARKGNKVHIIERATKIGKKIYATGNGKCNYTNTNYNCDCYRGEDTSIVSKVLERFSYVETIDFFKELGILPRNKNGYIYPYSEQASSVVEVLQMELDRLGVDIHLEENVISLEVKNTSNEYKSKNNKNGKYINENGDNKEKGKKKDNFKFIIKTDKGIYKTNNVIMAMGGKASPKLGSDGSGLNIAKGLGHKIITPNKALVQLKCNTKSLKSISGVRIQAAIKLIIEGKEREYVEYTNQGEIIFTDYGISGIPIMQLSRYASVALEKKNKVRVEVDFFPEMDYAELVTMLKNRKLYNPNKSECELLIGMINNKLATYIVKNYLSTKKEISKANVSKNNEKNKTIKNKVNEKKNKNNDIIMLKELVSKLKSMELEVVDTNSWDNAQVMAGGVSTLQINHKTMESKICKGLYITGELMDIDGTCGGYNLQWAWATGYIAGDSI